MNGINFRKMAVDLRAQLTTAQSDLAALREELAERNAAIELKQRDLIEAQTAVTGWAAKCKAAEQRNSELVALLRVVRDTLWQEDEDAAIFDRIDAAIKGAESGASDEQ